MDREDLNFEALAGASRNAEKAIAALQSEEYAAFPREERIAWAMAALIHCDMCRLVVALAECKVSGVAMLLWMSDISSKLYEAKRWYFNAGVPLLKKIAENKSCAKDAVIERIKIIKSDFPISKIDRYSTYRNKFAYHYDEDSLLHLENFGGESAEEFRNLLISFVQFSGEWAKLTRELIRNELSKK